ncbi:MAG: hypothetical protein WBI32_10385 [Halanaerobiales bacterium]
MILNVIREKTNKTMTEWKEVYGFAPKDVAEILNEVRLDWIIQLTDCLEIWVNKELILNEGELLLARVNLGAIVECWLKFFYCVYFLDYKKNPKKNKKDEMIHPRDLSFEYLIQYSRGILWDKDSCWEKWIRNIQFTRNAIHIFNGNDIGTNEDFINDLERLNKFIDIILKRLPDIV